MKDKIISLLKKHINQFISGEEISKKIGISRAAIWKHINSLKQQGYNIESVSKKGYKLTVCPDILTYEEIKSYLNTEFIGRNILHFDELDSTNTYAKSVADNLEGESYVVITEKQNNGRGRLGRQFMSQNNNGIWMSLILRPKLDMYEVSKITQVVAAAINSALNELNIKSMIKWPNDIIINDKKICGILTEMNSEINIINYIIVGIGINVNNDKEDFPDEIRGIASSLKIETGKEVKRNELLAKIFNNFEYLYKKFINGDFKSTLDICRKNSYVLGKKINVIKNSNIIEANAIDIDDNGELIVQYKDNKIEKVLSGEVSVRLKDDI